MHVVIFNKYIICEWNLSIFTSSKTVRPGLAFALQQHHSHNLLFMRPPDTYFELGKKERERTCTPVFALGKFTEYVH